MLQRLGIGQCVGVFDLLPVHDISYRQLHHFAADGTRNVGDRDNLRRHMPWRGIGADDLADLLLQAFIQRHSLAQFHEQHHPHIILPLLTDGHAVHDLRDFFDLAIDL